MKPNSLPGLSARARALLAAEREIVPQPPDLRRRAQLRARTSLWQGHDPRASNPPLIRAWKRSRVLLVAALVATSAVAAWHQLAPEPVDAPPAIAIGTAPRPTAGEAPRTIPPKASPTAASEPAAARSAPEPKLAPAAPKGSSPERTPTDGTRRQATPSEELTLLDSARRAVRARNFDRALRLIDRHARSFPKSLLREEREALRVRALQGAGKATQANHAAREFESRYPNSVLAPELNKGD